jgi:hypothetical protein
MALVPLVASAASAAGLWSSAQMVGPNDRPDSIFPNVEVSPDGTVWVVWSAADYVGGDSETYCVRIQDFVQSEREKIHEDNSFMDRCPLMSMGSDGIPWVVWERYGDAKGYVQVVSHWTGDGWAPADTVFASGSRWDKYMIHAASSNDVWVARSSRAAGRVDYDIYLRHWDGMEWGDIEQVGFEDEDDADPTMTTDDAGRTWLAWMRVAPTGFWDRVCASSRGDTGWSAPAVVNDGGGNMGVCDMSVCPDGRPVVVWSGNGQNIAGDLKYGVLGTAGWEFGGLVNEPDNASHNYDDAARLDRSSGEGLWVTWTSSFEHDTRSYVTASQWSGDGWSEEEVVSVPDTSDMQWDFLSDVAVAGDGRVWAVWERIQYSTGDTDIYVAYRDVATAVDVWALSAEDEGGSIRISWQASPDASRDGFHVWRADGEACPGRPGVIPDRAARLTDVPIRDCTSCTFTDDTATSAGTYCYWLDQVNGDVFGPVAASVSAADTLGVSFTAFPNPAGDAVVFEVTGGGAPCEIWIYTVGGRLVRTLAPTGRRGQTGDDRAATVHWDGVDGSGHRVPRGMYYAVLRAVGGGAGDVWRVKFVMLH